MRLLQNVSFALVGIALVALSGSFLFGTATITTAGWLISLPMFVGGAGIAGLSVYDMIPERKTTTDKKQDAGIDSHQKQPVTA